MKRGQNGFGAIETLLVLILLSILGFTGYYVYHSRNNANSTYNNASKSASSTPATASTNKFVFKELGVQVDLPSDLKDLTYIVNNQNGVQYLELTTPKFVEALSKCNPGGGDNSGAVFVSIDKKSGNFPSNPSVFNNDGSLLKQFDNFYIEAQYPNGLGCSDLSHSEDFTSVYTGQKEAVGEAFKDATLVQ